MRIKSLCLLLALPIIVSVTGCKEDKEQIASPSCANPVTASDPEKCPRGEGNIIRSKPETWELGGEKAR